MAAVQAEPRWLDIDAGTEQVLAHIDHAAAEGAQLVAFPGCFVPGFPWWMWLDPGEWGEEFRSRYLRNAMTRQGPQLRAIAETVRGYRIHVVLGFAERYGDQVYKAQALIGPDGLIRVRRKPDPDALERAVFSPGLHRPLYAETVIGRVGVLGGADHLEPPGQDQGEEDIHVACWPGFTVFRGAGQGLGPEVNRAASLLYAVRSGAYVVAPAAVVPVSGRQQWSMRAGTPIKQLLRGDGDVARIFSPDGVELARPLFPGEEGIVYADVDLSLRRDPSRRSRCTAR
ncbi:nitrilase-related carbon-nitrogen hydrolase [Nocardia asteroides]|uniref:nitrilase-related carbon-nitrogen hydrolase n=1 Tax=Nocardia asteroides TaxID=1824 RepID=UPI0037CB866F